MQRLNVTLYSLQPKQKITELGHNNKIYHAYVDKLTSQVSSSLQAEKNDQRQKTNKTLAQLNE